MRSDVERRLAALEAAELPDPQDFKEVSERYDYIANVLSGFSKMQRDGNICTFHELSCAESEVQMIGFGICEAEAKRFAAMGYDKTIRELMTIERPADPRKRIDEDVKRHVLEVMTPGAKCR